MYFRSNLLVYRFAKIFVEMMNSQTNEKSEWCHIFKNGGSTWNGKMSDDSIRPNFKPQKKIIDMDTYNII
jgi:hypothetical protein